MHGRLKVRTTEQERALKQQKQQQRMVAYRGAMARIADKRAGNEYDAEMLKLTGGLLDASPDIFTLWNVRRECLLRLQQTDPGTEAFRRDLEFTLLGLQANPKSYGAWHHRRWCLETMAEPDWQRELELCTQFLAKDERNFHVWDHRRYVATQSAVPAASELHFCTAKIDRNFSNYSAWHLRSKLLPQLHPHPSDPSRPIAADILRSELDKVLNATFTAPEDSSAWFYQRWLLGYSAPALDLAAFRVSASQALVTFSTPVNLNAAGCELRLDASTRFEMGGWRPVGVADGLQHSTIWQRSGSFALNAEAEGAASGDELQLEFRDEAGDGHRMQVRRVGEGLVGVKRPRFEYEFEASVREELEGQLRSYEELREIQREEGEAESKWALLTTALMMRAIDRPKYHATTLENLDKLRAVDPQRTGYYADLANKWRIEQQLEAWIDGGAEGDLDLSAGGEQLTALFYDQYLCVAPRIRLAGAGAELRAAERRKLVEVYAKCGVEIVGE